MEALRFVVTYLDWILLVMACCAGFYLAHIKKW